MTNYKERTTTLDSGLPMIIRECLTWLSPIDVDRLEQQRLFSYEAYVGALHTLAQRDGFWMGDTGTYFVDLSDEAGARLAWYNLTNAEIEAARAMQLEADIAAISPVLLQQHYSSKHLDPTVPFGSAPVEGAVRASTYKAPSEVRPPKNYIQAVLNYNSGRQLLTRVYDGVLPEVVVETLRIWTTQGYKPSFNELHLLAVQFDFIQGTIGQYKFAPVDDTFMSSWNSLTDDTFVFSWNSLTDDQIREIELGEAALVTNFTESKIAISPGVLAIYRTLNSKLPTAVDNRLVEWVNTGHRPTTAEMMQVACDCNFVQGVNGQYSYDFGVDGFILQWCSLTDEQISEIRRVRDVLYAELADLGCEPTTPGVPPLVIYHANCMDGLGALWAAKQWMPDVEPHAASYGHMPPDVTGRDVYILDFSYPREVLLEMHTKAKSLYVIDHHDTAQRSLEGLEFAHFDMAKSGAVLAWEFFSRLVLAKNSTRIPNLCKGGHSGLTDARHHASVPPLLQYIQDRDLWHYALPDSKAVNEYLRSKMNWDLVVESNLLLLDTIDEYWDADYEDYVEEGLLILGMRERAVTEAVDGVFYVTLPIDSEFVNIPACFSAFSIRSEVGHALASLPDNVTQVGLSIQGYRNGKFGLSFRGLPGTDLAQRLAVSFGGGGHKCASGAGITPGTLIDLLHGMVMPKE